MRHTVEWWTKSSDYRYKFSDRPGLNTGQHPPSLWNLRGRHMKNLWKSTNIKLGHTGCRKYCKNKGILHLKAAYYFCIIVLIVSEEQIVLYWEWKVIRQTQSPHHQKLEIQLNQWKLLSGQISAEKCTIRKKESTWQWPMKDFVRKTVHMIVRVQHFFSTSFSKNIEH